MTVIHYQELSTPTMMSMMMMMEATVTNGSCVVLTMTVTRWELLTLTMSSMIEETWANYCDGLSVAVDLCHRYLVVMMLSFLELSFLGLSFLELSSSTN